MVPKKSVFHRNKFFSWNMEDLQPISDADQAAFCMELAKQHVAKTTCCEDKIIYAT